MTNFQTIETSFDLSYLGLALHDGHRSEDLALEVRVGSGSTDVTGILSGDSKSLGRDGPHLILGWYRWLHGYILTPLQDRTALLQELDRVLVGGSC